MNHKRALGIAAVAALLACVLGLGVYIRSTRVIIHGISYHVDTTQLDLSGKSLPDVSEVLRLKELRLLDLRGTGISNEAYQAISTGLPECRILWEPVFQGRAYPADSESLTVTQLSAQDLQDLAYFPFLASIDATACRDYTQILSLRQCYPACRVNYRVSVGAQTFPGDSAAIVVHSRALSEVEAVLSYLPELRQLHFSEPIPPESELVALCDRWPELHITWDCSFYGQAITHRTTELDLTGIHLRDTAEIRKLLGRMRGILRVDLRGTGLSHQQAAGLAAAFPRVQFIWDIPIGSTTIRTDATEIDLSNNPITIAEIEALLPYCPYLTKVIMSFCGNTDAEMEQLNRRYGHIQFVWSVSIGNGKYARTDIRSFIPYQYHYDTYIMNQQDADNLRYCTQLIALDLGHQGITSCEFLACMPELRYVILSDTYVSDISPLAGNTNVVFLEIFDTPLLNSEPLLTLTGLRDLNISWCPADYRVIAQLTWLERCWWGGNQHIQAHQDYLREHCPDTQFEFRADYSTGYGWRKGPLYYQMRDALGMFYQ